MNVVVCPHCKSHRIVTSRVPKDVVAVMPCPSCGELVVLFRKKVIGLNREILEHGSMDDRKNHLATVIAEFLEPGMFSNALAAPEEDPAEARKPKKRAAQPEAGVEALGESLGEALGPISQREIDDFTKHHLERLDNAAYFRKHFG